MQPAIPEVAPSADLPDDNEAILNPHADYTIGSVVATVQTDLIFELVHNISSFLSVATVVLLNHLLIAGQFQ